jgi:hypothetical protein
VTSNVILHRASGDKFSCGLGVTEWSTQTLPMTTSKKKKSSTSVCISRPYAPRARTFTFHHNGNPTGSKTHAIVSAVSSETLGMLISKQPESDNSFSKYIADQTDMQHDDPNSDPGGKEKSKQRKHTMEEWLTYRDAYLEEMLRHDGREGLQVTFCADCGSTGDFSCYDCAYCMHYCQGCLLSRHRLMPLHRIRVCKPILSVIWHLKFF